MLSKKTILIAEDEDAILLALQRILELTGSYEVFTAHDGQIALSKLEGIVPDLIISDVSMPNVNGIELCRKIRGNPVTKSTPFIFLTGKKEMLIECINAGGDDFLMKPFNVEEVLVKIEALFRRISQSKEQASQYKGKIEDVPVQEILGLCMKEKISGDVFLQQSGEVGIIKLEGGDINSIDYRNLTDDAALDALMLWKKGTFVIRPDEFIIKADSAPILEEVDFNAARELAQNCWWVGSVTGRESTQVNVYLRIFQSNGKEIYALIDPGSPLYYQEISSKVSTVLKKEQEIGLYILMDSDPDVCLNSVFIRKSNPRAICLTSDQNWQSIKHYEIDLKNLKKVNLQKSELIKLSTGNSLKLIPTPFCKSASSFMTYDVENRILFSGALFSSTSSIERIKEKSLFADEDVWQEMAQYHVENISSNDALINGLNQLTALNPAPEIIAPRYGKMIKKEKLKFFIEKLKILSVGINGQKNVQMKMGDVEPDNITSKN